MKALVSACEFVGVRSLNLVLVIMVFTGMVLALQFTVGLSRFGLELYVGQIIGISIVRELGPVLTSLMIAARVGSGIAAELGSMVATEQVLAIEALGGNPVQKLVLPRLLATMLMTPLLTTIGNIVGILGGMVITIMEAGVTARFYFDQIQRTVEMSDIVSGLCKTVFFGYAIGLIACYEGLKTTGGTEGVGRSTTYAVVLSSLIIFISDFFLTKLFIVIYGY
jgi:phospholipid/cholesterol/gamma-HCH transport system permease protein